MWQGASTGRSTSAMRSLLRPLATTAAARAFSTTPIIALPRSDLDSLSYEPDSKPRDYRPRGDHSASRPRTPRTSNFPGARDPRQPRDDYRPRSTGPRVFGEYESRSRPRYNSDGPPRQYENARYDLSDRSDRFDRRSDRSFRGDSTGRPPRDQSQSVPPGGRTGSYSSQTEKRDIVWSHSRFVLAKQPVTHLLSLADLKPAEIQKLVHDAIAAKWIYNNRSLRTLSTALEQRTIALIFSKRSTRTRVSAESAITLLRGHAMFLGKDDIQLGVNESLRDSAQVIGSMTDGILARVHGHEEVEALAKHSSAPVINALSDLYHPLQILADLQTLIEHYKPFNLEEAKPFLQGPPQEAISQYLKESTGLKATLAGKKFAWVGDTNNIINELLITLPRFGMKVAVASPSGYDKVDERVMDILRQQGTLDQIQFTNDPKEAVKDADVVCTDTWISMGQEEETAIRKEAFDGFRVTKELCAEAKPGWLFMHCLPRHQEEVDDEVFYGENSLVFPEAENRKWTAMATFASIFGRQLGQERQISAKTEGEPRQRLESGARKMEPTPAVAELSAGVIEGSSPDVQDVLETTEAEATPAVGEGEASPLGETPVDAVAEESEASPADITEKTLNSAEKKE